MGSNWFQRIALQILIVLSIALSGITAFACGWTLTDAPCATDNNPHGASCDLVECYCGDWYYIDDMKKIRRCRQGANWGYYCKYSLQDEVYEWVPDSDNSCCGSSDSCCGIQNCCTNEGQTQACTMVDGCPGSQTCTNKQWSSCQGGACCPLN